MLEGSPLHVGVAKAKRPEAVGDMCCRSSAAALVGFFAVVTIDCLLNGERCVKIILNGAIKAKVVCRIELHGQALALVIDDVAVGVERLAGTKRMHDIGGVFASRLSLIEACKGA